MSSTHQHPLDGPCADVKASPNGPANEDLIRRFMGAAFDRCQSCQNTLMAELVADAVTAARLVELACIAIDSAVGGLPATMTDDDAGGRTPRQFRILARAGAGGANAAMYNECSRMTTADRRIAAEWAADLLVAQLFM